MTQQITCVQKPRLILFIRIYTEATIVSFISITKNSPVTFPNGLCKHGKDEALKPVLELPLVGQVGLELTEIHLPLPPECWD